MVPRLFTACLLEPGDVTPSHDSLEVLDYFKQKSAENGIPYQTLINLYLQDCRATRRNLKLKWAP